MPNLNWYWVYTPYLDAPEKQKESAVRAGYDKFYIKSEVDKVVAKLEAENAQLKKEISFMHTNCRWHAGDACARLLGEKLALIDENAQLKSERNHYGTQEWQEKLKSYEAECREKGKQ